MTQLRSTLPALAAAAAVALVCGAAPLSAQGAPAAPESTARPADVGTIDSIIPALYATISGPVGQPRDWPRMRSLFHPDARLMPTGCDRAGACRVRILTPDEYSRRSDSLLVAVGFREREIGREVERFGNVAHVWSTYESWRRDETEPFMRGINSIQLLWDGKRWWVMSVFWDNEREGNPLPRR
jgi:hypothetical protein